MTRIVIPRDVPIKRNVVSNPKRRRKWAESRPSCYFCGTTMGVETHHIVGGSGKRSDEPCNFVRACGACHRKIHGTEKPKISLVSVLTAKRAADPDEYDFDRLQELHGSKWTLEEALK